MKLYDEILAGIVFGGGSGGSGYPEPAGVKSVTITENTTTNVNIKDYASVSIVTNIESYPEPTGSISITSNGTVNVKDFASAIVNVPSTPAPTGSVTITSNGTYDVSDKASAVVNVPAGSSPVWTDLSYMYYKNARLTDMPVTSLQTNDVTSVAYMFYQATDVTTLDLSHIDTTEMKSMSYVCNGCSNLTSLDLTGWDTNKCTSSTQCFASCTSLTDVYIRDTELRSDGKLKFKLPSSSFWNVIANNGGHIHLSATLQSAYEDATNWSSQTILVFDQP